ncbi:MAG: hypothetical protein GXO85_02265 [Chlorobi bacterium]|nr:hypothetical protein [Chlorobiota bacterium]
MYKRKRLKRAKLRMYSNASKAAQKLLDEHAHINILDIGPTGKKGAITIVDVRNHIEHLDSIQNEEEEE